MAMNKKFKEGVKGTFNKPQTEVYTSGHAKSFIYMSLPSTVTTLWSLVTCGSISGLAYFFGDRLDPARGGYFWFSVTVGVMTLLAFCAMGIKGARGKKRQRQAEQFEGSLKESAGGWGDGEDDAAEIKRLDDLRANFQKGIETFREYGKDVYSMPWYVIVGEPGSGKTEAIRHSDLKFPDTLQDKLQGTGGTYSMHWWFTNHAVLLDTAGAMLMNAEAGQRFEEFLKLLRKGRPECPINGLLLTIPVDSLLMDDMATSEEKARTIAEQLGLIQKTLDLRFPIYLMITKSDRLPGFREFCDATGQDRFERQMVGWSNEADLDEEFRAGTLDSAIEGLSMRLRSRRMALLADPIPRKPGSRRLDEVDALYTFPETINSLVPRLKRYLEILFQTGEWAKKTPFFRGLYFTSAMREGATLDQELASAMGMPLNQLPQGGVWSDQKSLFLRDMFMEKVFKERGLVTRLVDIGQALRRRLLWLFGTVAVILVSLLLLALLVKHGIENDLQDDARYWNAANNNWENGSFLSLIEKGPQKNGLPQWNWVGKEPGISGREDCENRFELLSKVQQKSVNGVAWGFVFRPLPVFREMERSRRFAWRVLFEGAVIKPVLDAARSKMSLISMTTGGKKPGAAADSSDESVDVGASRALAALVDLEAVLEDEKGEPFPKEKFRDIFTPLYQWVCTGTEPFGPEEAASIVTMASQCYTDEFPLSSRKWMSEGSYLASPSSKTSGLSSTQEPIQGGINLFLALSKQVEVASGKEQEFQARLRESASQFRDAEDDLYKLSGEGSGVEFNTVSGLMVKLELAASDIRKTQQERNGAGGQLPPEEYLKLRKKIEAASKSSKSGVLGRINRQLKDSAGLESENRDHSTAGNSLYSEFLQNGSALERFSYYQKSLTQTKSRGTLKAGRLKQYVDGIKDSSTHAPETPEDQKKTGKLYEGARKEVCAANQKYLQSWSREFLISEACKQYIHLVQRDLDGALHFPVAMSPRTLTVTEYRAQCTKILFPMLIDRKEWPNLEAPTCEAVSRLNQLFEQLQPVFKIVDALCTGAETGTPIMTPLELTMGASAAAKEKQKPVVVNPPQQNPGLFGGAQPPPAPPPEEELDQDITEVLFETGTLASGLTIAFQGAPDKNGSSSAHKPYPNDGFRLQIKGNKGTMRNQSYLKGSGVERLEEWGIIKGLLENHHMEDNQFQKIRVILEYPVRGRPFSVTVKFGAPLPSWSDWPNRASFGFLKENAPTQPLKAITP